MAAAARWIEAQQPQLVVITGDVTRFGRTDEFTAAARFVNSLSSEVVGVAGNHDTPYAGMLARLFFPFARYTRAMGPAGADFRTGEGWALTTINTARGIQPRLNWSKGAISPAQVEWAVASLACALPGVLKMVACHHPLVEMVDGPMSGRVRGGAAAAQRLCEVGVDLVLSGHVHAPFAMALPFGDGRTHAVGAGTLSLRERGSPPGFNVIGIGREDVSVTALAWTGSHFDPWRTWSFPRRTAAEGG